PWIFSSARLAHTRRTGEGLGLRKSLRSEPKGRCVWVKGHVMRRSTIYVACAILAAICCFAVAPRQILQHQYRYLPAKKKGRLSLSDDRALRQAIVIATWRGVSFGWQTSYWCDAQTAVRPDASGAFTIPDVSRRVDVSALWLSRLLGTEVDFSWDLFVYV